jgi:DeoR/GlpR family transcriptional regulator of sugar metabolism
MIYLPRYLSADIHITNSIGLLHEISKVNNYNWILISLGGIFKPRNLSVYGSDTLKNVESYYPTKTFVSCTGISPVNKIADSSPHEGELKRMMTSRAQEVFLLADHTKFEKTRQVFFCDFSSMNYIITDSKFSLIEPVPEFINQNSINLVIADNT